MRENAALEMVAAALAANAASDDGAVWISRFPDEVVLERARLLDALPAAEREALPLFGLPFAVKDNIDVAGLPTTAACPAYAYEPKESSGVVERLVRAGAIPLGKTNLDQFATGLVGTRSPYGTPRNPFDARMVPGGSSSGSAVAVAQGFAAFSLGTDTAGSGRVPAAFNGLIGVKPTRGLLSAAGVVPACRSLDCVSIFAPDLDLAQSILDVAAGYDARDPFSREHPGTSPSLDAAFRFGVPQPGQRIFFGDDEAQKNFEAAIDALAASGGTPVEVDFTTFYDTTKLLYDGAFVAERTTAVGDFVDENPSEILEITRTIVQSGRRFTAVDAFNADYTVRGYRTQAAKLFEGLATIVVPTVPTAYTVEAMNANPYELNGRLGTYTNFVNLLDMCALAIPSGRYASGFPMGITLLGRAFEDGFLAAIARRVIPNLPPRPLPSPAR